MSPLGHEDSICSLGTSRGDRACAGVRTHTFNGGSDHCGASKAVLPAAGTQPWRRDPENATPASAQSSTLHSVGAQFAALTPSLSRAANGNVARAKVLSEDSAPSWMDAAAPRSRF
jgi:hypothetical protein